MPRNRHNLQTVGKQAITNYHENRIFTTKVAVGDFRAILTRVRVQFPRPISLFIFDNILCILLELSNLFAIFAPYYIIGNNEQSCVCVETDAKRILCSKSVAEGLGRRTYAARLTSFNSESLGVSDILLTHTQVEQTNSTLLLYRPHVRVNYKAFLAFQQERPLLFCACLTIQILSPLEKVQT